MEPKKLILGKLTVFERNKIIMSKIKDDRCMNKDKIVKNQAINIQVFICKPVFLSISNQAIHIGNIYNFFRDQLQLEILI